MTIDEAISKYKEITNTDAICPAHCNIPCDKCVRESEQIVEWLEDYKRIKMLAPIEQALKNEYNKAIDDFATKICQILEEYQTGFNMVSMANVWHFSRELAEQLKAGRKE